MVRLISLGLLLFGFWILLSGHFEPLLLILGVLSSAAVVALAWRMDVIDHESHPIHLTFKLPGYWIWLLWEIVKANVAVAKLIWQPSLPISPTVVKAPASQKTDLGLVVFANSITLTPGTVSMIVNDHDVEVHAITRAMADDVVSGAMDRRVSQLEGGG